MSTENSVLKLTNGEFLCSKKNTAGPELDI
jgi:hypothetical protein